MAERYHHLSGMERALIEAHLTQHQSPSWIALELKRARSTITREIHRNGWKPGGRKGVIAGGYRCVVADRRARVLAGHARRERKLVMNNPLWETVLGYLAKGLSPVQIASTLSRMEDPVQLSHETIYTSLYAMPRGHLRAEVLDLLRRRHKCRRTYGGKKTRHKSIPDMTLIDDRPKQVDARRVPGDWEGDLIIGKGNLSQVGVLVERTTLFIALVKLVDGKADTVAKSFSKILNRFASQLRRSLTYDQGSEMSLHKTLSKRTGIKVYFAHPHSPWERGICENINGLLRQYLPKGTDLSSFSQRQLDDIAWLLNTRPRKTLKWKAPAELFLPKGSFDFVRHWSQGVDLVALRS